MRKVTSALFSSVDGVVENPGTWQFDQFDDGLGAMMSESLARQDAVILGRKTYDEWAPYWPTASDPFGQFINPVAKHVASRTLAEPLDWQNAKLIDGDLLDFVRRLKATEGGEINVAGSLSIVGQLLDAGLLDALTLMVHPVIVGQGRRLFDDSQPIARLVLADQQTTEKGNLISTYVPHAD